ncbi:MAG: DUF192 domain-containing protein [Candidatus Nanohaloarchaeota archaeon]|nr:DUF192 domain-containing protein [Candidatus Nanohaloarchaeota archaeon]
MKIKICDTFLSRIKGLMVQKEGHALLDFKKEGIWKIWMFGMRYDLILYFINQKGIVVGKEYAPKLTFNPFTWKTYYAKSPYRYVLEIDARDKNAPSFMIGENVLSFIKQAIKSIKH